MFAINGRRRPLVLYTSIAWWPRVACGINQSSITCITGIITGYIHFDSSVTSGSQWYQYTQNVDDQCPSVTTSIKNFSRLVLVCSHGTN